MVGRQKFVQYIRMIILIAAVYCTSLLFLKYRLLIFQKNCLKSLWKCKVELESAVSFEMMPPHLLRSLNFIFMLKAVPCESVCCHLEKFLPP